jgi:hypothetical protein
MEQELTHSHLLWFMLGSRFYISFSW